MRDRAGSTKAGTLRTPAVIGWSLFDWAAQPYFTLITTFVFAPYFAAHVATSAVEGRASTAASSFAAFRASL
jgi:UMF1 family MFS transporter